MAGVTLADYQRECVDQLTSGKVLAAGVGAGKSIMAIVWYLENYCHTRISHNSVGTLWQVLKGSHNLLIITTPKKRNNLEWDTELAKFALTQGDNTKDMGNVTIIVDSWNNITKYRNIPTTYAIIFDEQRAIGHGAWAKSFITIAQHHPWIMLSATPGDDWNDWCPVMIANGFYRNRTEFFRRHAVYSRYTKFPRIDKWINVDYLEYCRSRIMITCEVPRTTNRIVRDITCEYDKQTVKQAMKDRWNPITDLPFVNASELCAYLRRVINTDPTRLDHGTEIVKKHRRVIIFYSLRVEMEQILELEKTTGIHVYQYNGSVHESIPEDGPWIYAVQYVAGSDGWNCTTCDTILYWDLPYSYKALEQSAGRIDRFNTPFKDLYYYKMWSHSALDLGIRRALSRKKNFNIRGFVESQQTHRKEKA